MGKQTLDEGRKGKAQGGTYTEFKTRRGTGVVDGVRRVGSSPTKCPFRGYFFPASVTLLTAINGGFLQIRLIWR